MTGRLVYAVVVRGTERSESPSIFGVYSHSYPAEQAAAERNRHASSGIVHDVVRYRLVSPKVDYRGTNARDARDAAEFALRAE
jgi:hypothetical protein